MNINIFGDIVINSTIDIDIDNSLRDLLNHADYNIANFEAPIKDNNSKRSLKSGPSLNQSSDASTWLYQNHFNVFSMANNHILDYGCESAKNSVEIIRSNCFSTIGLGNWENAYQPLIIEENDIKVAIFAMAELQFGFLHDKWSQDKDDFGCAWINHSSVNKLIRKAKQENDYVIMIAHSGLEGVDVPLPEWRDRYRELIDEGCDVVVGGHTHTVQGYEMYNGKPIFYSLGNFCFQKNKKMKDYWYNGQCVSLKIEKDCLCFDDHGTRFSNNTLSLVDEKEWEITINKLNKMLDMPDYSSIINNICQTFLQKYETMCSRAGYICLDKELFKSIARIIAGRCNKVHMLHNLQCESHRWCFARGLRLRQKIQ